MPVSLSYPGVYIEEIPSGVHTITGVATSITAFVGRTPRGPVDAAVTLNGFAEFQRTFGELATSFTLGYAVRDFFMNGGGQAVIVRRWIDDGVRAAVQATAAAAAASTGNPVAVAAAARAQANTFPAGPVRTAAGAIATAAETASTATGATPLTVMAAVQSAALAVLPSDRAALSSGSVTFSANSPGVWGAKLSVKIDRDGIDADVASRFGLAVADLFNVTVVLDPPNGPRERIRNVTATSASHARAVERVLPDESNWITASVDRSGTLTQPPLTPGNQDPTNPANFQGTVAVVFFQGGRDSAALAAKADYLGSPAARTGLYALDSVDLFNLLCVPPDLRDADATLAVTAAVNAEALAYCVKRRAMLIVDPPKGWGANPATAANTAKTGVATLGVVGPDARNAVLYFPRVQMSDPMRGGQVDSFPACGVVAGVMARTDETRGVWKAPAGVDAALTGVAGLDVSLTDAENGLLNPVAINCLRSFPIYGNLLWGARTMRGADQLADDYKYVPVRRLALFIEESLFRGLKWVVFEPNDEPLWALIRLNVGAFMQNLFRQGAFQGSSPREAYFVRCDAETTLPGDVNLGIVNIVVGFAPLKPAEFVVLQLQQIVAQNQ